MNKLKNLLISAILPLVCWAQPAFADTCQSSLMPTFTAGQSVALCTKLPASVSTSIIPQTDDAIDLGSSTKEFRNIYIDGTVTTDALVNSGDSTLSGEIKIDTSGKTLALQEATSASKCMGSLTCNGASDVTTSTTCATTGSRIFLTRTSLDTDTTGDFYVKSISDGVSFTVACEASDTATLNWIIFHEAP